MCRQLCVCTHVCLSVWYVWTEIWDCDCFWHSVRSHLDLSQLASGLFGACRFFFSFLVFSSIFCFMFSADLIHFYLFFVKVRSKIQTQKSILQKLSGHNPFYQVLWKTFYIRFNKTLTTLHLSLFFLFSFFPLFCFVLSFISVFLLPLLALWLWQWVHISLHQMNNTQSHVWCAQWLLLCLAINLRRESETKNLF